MKCSIFLLIVFTGCVCGLQAPLHYKYKYYGSVSNGIPELSSKASGWAMKADVNVYVLKDDGESVFQIENVKMIEYTGDLKCDSRGDIPDELFTDIPDPDIKRVSDTPFKVHLFHYKDFSIEYEDNEYLWLTNMRKGVVSVFRNEILKGNIDKQISETVAKSLHEGHIINVFSVDEETLFGKCTVHYTLHPIPEYIAATRNTYLEKHYEQDVQRQVPESAAYKSKTSKQPSKSPRKSSKTPAKYQRTNSPDIKDDLWHVVRTVDLDKCEESVGLENGNTFEANVMNVGQLDWRMSRSSVSEYIFRGSAGHFRLEKAVVEGAKTLAPNGFKTELLQTRINQTFQLISVESADSAPYPQGNLKHSKTWMQHFFSPGVVPHHSKNYPWVEYDTEEGHVGYFQIFGVKGPNEEQVKKNKMEIVNHIFTTLPYLVDSTLQSGFPTFGVTVWPLLEAVNLMKEMNKEEVIEIFSKLDGDYKELLNFGKWKFSEDPANYEKIKKIYKHLVVDTASASGTGAAYEAIIELAKEEKVSLFDVMTTIMTIINNSEYAFSFITDYVVSLDVREQPFTTSSIIINTAYYLNKLCFNPEVKDHFVFGPLSENKACPHDIINNKFIPYLENIIFNKEFTWERNVAIFALCQLGSSYSYQILTSVITEERMKFPINSRAYAIDSLDGRIFYKYNLRKPIMNLLTEIYTNVGEDITIRERALHMIMTWGPESHIFYQLAKMSWRDPSRQFSSLLTTMIETMSEIGIPEFQKYEQAAFHALKFARPVAPIFKYNYIKTIVSHYVDKHISITNAFEWLTSDKSSKLKFFYYGIFSNFGGFHGNQIEIGVETERLFNLYGELMERIYDEEEEGKIDGTATKVAEEFYSNMEETLKSHVVHKDHTDPGVIYMSLFQNMKYFLPNFFSKFKGASKPDQTKFDFNFAKLITPINVRTAYPTEVGLPVFMEIVAPILSSLTSNVELHLENDFPSGSVDFDIYTRMIGECHSSLGVLLPWSKQIAEVHTFSTREIALPLQGTVARSANKDDRKQYKWRLDLQMPSDIWQPLFTAASMSLIQRKSIYPTTDVQNMQPNLIFINQPKKPEIFKLPRKKTGLNIDVMWLSDLEFPFTHHNIERIMHNPGSFIEAPFMPLSFITSSLKPWALMLNLKPLGKQNFTIEFTNGKFGKSESESFAQERGEFSQYGQEGIGQYDQEQEGLSGQEFTQDLQEIGGSGHGEDTPHLTYGDSIQKRDEKLQNIYGGPGYLQSLKLSIEGEEHRSLEVLFTKAKLKESGPRRLKKSGITIIRSPIPEFDIDPALVCVNYEASLPGYSKLYNLKDYSSDNSLHKETKLEVTLGCTGEPIVALEGVYKVSEAWIKKLQTELPKYCDFDPHDEKQNIYSHLIYDDVKYDISWKNICNDKYPITTKAIKLLEDLADRLSHNQCYTLDQTNKMHVEVYRCPLNENWNIKVLQENSEEKFEEIPHNHIFNHLFSVGRKTTLELHPEIHSLFNLESDNCVVGVDSVRTFDGYTYEYKPSQCWSVASKVCNKEKGPMLLVRSPDTESTIPEMKYIDVQKGIVVEYSHDNVKVNGKLIDPVDGKEIITDDHGHALLTVIKKDDFFMVKFEDRFYISAKNKVVIHAPRSYAGTLCGICGNFNGEPVDDLIGPHRCPYSDPNTFIASWTGKSDKCDLYSLLELREVADNFQKECSTVESIYESRPPISQQCYYTAKSVLKTEDSFCLSQNYVQYCREGCEETGHKDNEETFLCWPVDDVPPSLKEALSSDAPIILFDPEETSKYTKTHSIGIISGCLPGKH